MPLLILNPSPARRGAVSIPAPVAAVSPESRRRRILVIECITDVAQFFAQLLTMKGYDVRWASSRPEGLRVAREFEPDVILLCTFYPQGMTGYDQCNVLRWGLGLPRLKIIMMSAIPGEEVRRRAMESGADDFLFKPFSLNALLHAIHRLEG